MTDAAPHGRRGILLVDANPELAAQFHPTLNGELSVRSLMQQSGKKVWWLGTCGHSWDARVQDRSKGNGCPYCAGRLAITGVNDLATLAPGLASEWHPTKNGDLNPSTVMRQSNKKVWWLGTCGHDWDAMVYTRTANGGGCPYCAGKATLVGFNDLATLAPDLAAEWHPSNNGDLRPTMVTRSSGRKVSWLGACGHDWESTITHRSDRGDGCPYCSGRAILVGFNDLGTISPNLAAEWHPNKNGDLKPSMVTRSSNKTVSWLGTCDHTWESTVANRGNGDGCPTCRGLIILVGFNDLATLFPKLAAEWHPSKNGNLLPSMVTRGSQKKVWWIGTCGHEWPATIAGRSNGIGCPYCWGRLAIEGLTDLATREPDLASEWHPTLNGDLKPHMVTRQSGKKVWWLGACDHDWESTVANRSNGNGCPWCAGRWLEGFNDLATLNPSLAAEWHPTRNGDLMPSMVSNGSEKKVWWLGACGHDWDAIVSSRVLGRSCPTCSVTGFKPDRPGYLYFLEHPGFCAYKVGITNTGTDRLTQFLSSGWKIQNLELFEYGAQARIVESVIKNWWRVDLGLRVWMRPEEMRIGGWTETVSSVEVTAAECIARIKLEASIVRALEPEALTDLVIELEA